VFGTISSSAYVHVCPRDCIAKHELELHAVETERYINTHSTPNKVVHAGSFYYIKILKIWLNEIKITTKSKTCGVSLFPSFLLCLDEMNRSYTLRILEYQEAVIGDRDHGG
jgi:hypothetical protein